MLKNLYDLTIDYKKQTQCFSFSSLNYKKLNTVSLPQHVKSWQKSSHKSIFFALQLVQTSSNWLHDKKIFFDDVFVGLSKGSNVVGATDLVNLNHFAG